MIRKILLENDAFSVSRGFFGGIRVELKHRRVSINVHRIVSDHFKATIDEFAASGGSVSYDDDEFVNLVEDFAETVFGTEARMLRYLLESPSEKAKEFHDITRRVHRHDANHDFQ